VLFSIAPLAIVLVSVFGLVLQDEELREDVTDRIVDALPVSVAGRQDVEKAITSIATPASAVGLVSLVLFVWAATGMMGAIRQGLERALGVDQSRPAVRAKLVDLALIVGTAVLVLVLAGVTVLDTLVQRASSKLASAIGLNADVFGSVILRTSTFVLAVAVALLLYRFVPARGIAFRDGVVGALVTAVALLLISLASGYIYNKTSQLSVVYGSLTAALVFLYSVYLAAAALLLGAEVAAAWGRPEPPPGPPLLVQVKRGLLGLVVHQPPEPSSNGEMPEAEQPGRVGAPET
jgi:membrane protein